MKALRISPAADRRSREAFRDLPYRLHREDPCWVAPLRRMEGQRLDPARNPALDGRPHALFLARRGEQDVGRIAAFRRANGEGGFGLFESTDDQEVAGALVAEARNWLRSCGSREAVGPMSFSTNEECGVLVSGFETPPTLLNVHNPPYYDRLLRGAGLTKAKDLFQYSFAEPVFPERYRKTSLRRVERMGIRIRTSTRASIEEDARIFGRLFNRIWDENWGFEELSEREIVERAKQLKLILRPQWVVIAERDGEPVGMALALPDLNEIQRKHKSGALAPNLLHLLFARHRLKRVRVPLLGVVRELRRTGTEAAMLSMLWKNCRRDGVDWAEAGWVLEDNSAMHNLLLRVGFDHYKTLRMYRMEA